MTEKKQANGKKLSLPSTTGEERCNILESNEFLKNIGLYKRFLMWASIKIYSDGDPQNLENFHEEFPEKTEKENAQQGVK